MMYDEAQPLGTPFLMASLRVFREWTTFKILPHGQGTLGERQAYLDIIKILQAEENGYSNWEMEQTRKKNAV